MGREKEPADADIDRLTDLVRTEPAERYRAPQGGSKRTHGCVCHARDAAAAAFRIAKGYHAARRIRAFFDPMIVIAAHHPDAPGTARADDKPDVMRPDRDDAGGWTGRRMAISGKGDRRCRACAVIPGAL